MRPVATLKVVTAWLAGAGARNARPGPARADSLGCGADEGGFAVGRADGSRAVKLKRRPRRAEDVAPYLRADVGRPANSQHGLGNARIQGLWAHLRQSNVLRYLPTMRWCVPQCLAY